MRRSRPADASTSWSTMPPRMRGAPSTNSAPCHRIGHRRLPGGTAAVDVLGPPPTCVRPIGSSSTSPPSPAICCCYTKRPTVRRSEGFVSSRLRPGGIVRCRGGGLRGLARSRSDFLRAQRSRPRSGPGVLAANPSRPRKSRTPSWPRHRSAARTCAAALNADAVQARRDKARVASRGCDRGEVPVCLVGPVDRRRTAVRRPDRGGVQGRQGRAGGLGANLGVIALGSRRSARVGGPRHTGSGALCRTWPGSRLLRGRQSRCVFEIPAEATSGRFQPLREGAGTHGDGCQFHQRPDHSPERCGRGNRTAGSAVRENFD